MTDERRIGPAKFLSASQDDDRPQRADQDLHQLNAALVAEVTKARQVAEKRTATFAQVSGIANMLDALRTTELQKSQLDLVNAANASTHTLRALLDDILGHETAVTGTMTAEQTSFDVHKLISHVASLWQPSADRKRLQLQLDMDKDLPVCLNGDPARLTQILSNLISNAIRFTNDGGLTISADTLGTRFSGYDDSEEIMLRLTVQDSGIGMSAQDQLRLSDDVATGTATFGNLDNHGLGLNIIRQLTALMRGEIAVESTLGLGTCVTLILPFRQGTDTQRQKNRISEARQRDYQPHILVVDDNDTNLIVATAILKRLGCRTTTSVNGSEAVTVIQNNAFDLVMMDCHMPVMDGIDATRSIRSWEQSVGNQAIPIIAVSASTHAEEQTQRAAAGMNDFLNKPITVTSIRTMLQKWLGTATPPSIQAPKRTGEAQLRLPEDHFQLSQFVETQQLSGNAFNDLLKRYLQDMKQLLEAIKNAAQSRDVISIKRSAHKIKGASASIGAHLLAELAHLLEFRIEDKQLDDIDEDIDLMAIEVETVTRALRSYLGEVPTSHDPKASDVEAARSFG